MEFAGSVGQYVGQRLLLWQEGGAFDLRFEDELVGRLTRPDEAYLAETRDGSWRLWHKHRTAPKIRVTDPASGTETANYKRRALRSGGPIVTAAGNRYTLRPHHLIDSSGNELLTLVYDDEESGLLALTPVGQSEELAMLVMLCAYISLLENVPVPDTGGGPGA